MLPVSPERPVQQISVQGISSFVARVLENRDEHLGERIDIASDELSGIDVARIISGVTGRRIEYTQTSMAKAYETNEDAAKAYETNEDAAKAYETNEDAAKAYEWFDTVGYTADIQRLSRGYPQVGWQTFEEWARAQNWAAAAASITATV